MAGRGSIRGIRWLMVLVLAGCGAGGRPAQERYWWHGQLVTAPAQQPRPHELHVPYHTLAPEARREHCETQHGGVWNVQLGCRCGDQPCYEPEDCNAEGLVGAQCIRATAR